MFRRRVAGLCLFGIGPNSDIRTMCTLDKQRHSDLILSPQIPESNNIQNGLGLFASYKAITLAY